MKNFLNIILVVFLTVLLMQMFATPQHKDGLNIDFASSSYTLPASVSVKVSNFTEQKVTLNACENIFIRKNGEKISFSEKFCEKNKNIEADIKKVSIIDLNSEYEKFKETGTYDLEVNIGEKKFTGKTEVENKGFFGKIFTDLIYAPVYNLVIWLINIFQGSFGWAIIAVTIILRVALLWPQHKSMVSQRKLQDLQPKIKKIQEENKGNQQVIGMKIFELYKQEKVNPMGSCGFLLIQLPIMLVLYNVIMSIQDPSNSYYLYSFLQNFDLNSIIYNFYGLQLMESAGTQGLILASIVAILQFFQIKYSLSVNPINNTKKDGIVLEKKAGQEGYNQMMPDPEVMNKFMLYVLPIIAWIGTYSLFAGVGIYWGITTIFMLSQQIIVNKMLKKSS